MDLPRFILLKSNANHKFLCYTKQEGNHSSLRFSYEARNPQQEKKADDDKDESDKIGFHHLKLEVEKAKSVEGLVHIRSCYNNKYLARKSIDNNNIVAGANEADEDQSKWSCTLFKPVFLEGGGESAHGNDDDADLLPLSKAYKISLLHVCESGQRSVRTTSKSASDIDDDELVVGDAIVIPSDDGTLEDSTDLAFTAFDVEATAILPEYVAFMGSNDKYLVSTTSDIFNLVFQTSDIGEQGVAHRVDTSLLPQPTSIFDKNTNKLWLYIPSDGSINSSPGPPPVPVRKSLFAPLKVGSFTALKCMDNNCFVSRGIGDALFATATTISENAMLRVAEPIRTREIIDATYDLADSRIYNVNSIEKFSDSRSNHTDVEQEGSFQVEYDTEQKMTWTNSTTVNIGVSVSWSAGIPVIGTLGVDISYEHDQTWTSGGENTTGKKITYTQNIKIPPRKKVTLKVVAQKAYCDVAYTCTARDLMTDGTPREYELDGLYSGCNEFEFNSDLTSEDL